MKYKFLLGLLLFPAILCADVLLSTSSAADVAAVAVDVAAVEAEVTGLQDPYQAWTATLTPVNGTATVTRAHGTLPMLTLADSGTISVPTTGWPTNGVSRFSLALWAGTNSVTLLTNTVDYSSTPTISTNDWTTILYRRVNDQSKWKGVGL